MSDTLRSPRESFGRAARARWLHFDAVLIVGASDLTPLPEFCSHNNRDANDLDDKSEAVPRRGLRLVHLRGLFHVATGARAGAGSDNATRQCNVTQRRTDGDGATSRSLAD